MPCSRWVFLEWASLYLKPKVMMNPVYLIRLVLLLSAMCSFHGMAADQVASFAELPEGDQLEVSLTVHGCLPSFSTYNLTFRRGAETTAFITEGRVALGQLTLREADVDDLDGLVRFYKSSFSGNCTGWRSITISQRHGGEIVGIEKYIDNSCHIRSTAGILALVERLKKKSQ